MVHSCIKNQNQSSVSKINILIHPIINPKFKCADPTALRILQNEIIHINKNGNLWFLEIILVGNQTEQPVSVLAYEFIWNLFELPKKTETT